MQILHKPYGIFFFSMPEHKLVCLSVVLFPLYADRILERQFKNAHLERNYLLMSELLNSYKRSSASVNKHELLYMHSKCCMENIVKSE